MNTTRLLTNFMHTYVAVWREMEYRHPLGILSIDSKKGTD